MLPLYKPYLSSTILKHAHDALDSQWIIWTGEYRDRATAWLKQYLGASRLMLLANGTCACHFLAKAVQLCHPNIKKAIVPNNVYTASWHGLMFDGGLELIPIDADINTWNFDINKIEDRLDSDTCVLVVHNLGNIINVPDLKRRFPSTVFIEDNCEGLTGEYEGVKSGTVSLASAMSFCGNKIITSGEGGALVVDNDELYDYLFSAHCQGYTSERFVCDKIGYNYRMTNIQAAILLGQMEALEEIKSNKARITNRYYHAFEQIPEVRTPLADANTINADWMTAVRVVGSPGYEQARAFFDKSGIDTRPMFHPITRHPHLRHLKCDTTIADLLSKECMQLPSFPGLTDGDVDSVINCVKNFIHEVVHGRV